MSLYMDWILAKETERLAVESRRMIEDQLVKQFEIQPSDEGTKNIERDGFKIKIVSRIDRKVDVDKLQEIAAEHGLTGQLGMLFRWKADVNAKAWEFCNPEVVKPLVEAITAKPGRPSFTITKEQ